MKVGLVIQNTERYRSWRTLWRWRRRACHLLTSPVPVEWDCEYTLRVQLSHRSGVVYLGEFEVVEGLI